jgi:hypothetical protein
MNKNQNFIQFTPADQQPSRHQIREKIWGKRKTTCRPKFDSGSDRVRERESLMGVPWPLAGSVGERDRGRAVAVRSQAWGDGEMASSGGIASKRLRRRWDREPLRWDGERSRRWVTEVRSRQKWDREVRNRESESESPRCRRWDREKLEVKSWEWEWVRDREAEWERENGVRTEEGRLKMKKMGFRLGKKEQNDVVLE